MNRNPLLHTVATAFVLALLCSCATTGPKLPSTISINPGAGRWDLIVVPVKVEGQGKLQFVLDTGSSATLLDKSLEPKLGKRAGTMSVRSWGKTGSMPLYKAPGLALGGTPLITGDNVGTYFFTEMRRRSGHPIMGMLSIDCLKNYCIQFDFRAGKIRFLDPEEVHPDKLGKAFPITYVGGRPFVNHEGLVPGIGTNTLIDTGYDRDGAIRELPRPNNYVPERAWNGGSYTNLILGNGGYVLGLRFLARHLVTLDFPGKTMYLLQQSSGPLPGDRFRPPS